MSRSERLARMKAETTSDPLQFARWVRDHLDRFLAPRGGAPREVGYTAVTVETCGDLVRLRVSPPAAESPVEPTCREATFRACDEPVWDEGTALVGLPGPGWPRSRHDAMLASNDVIALAVSLPPQTSGDPAGSN